MAAAVPRRTGGILTVGAVEMRIPLVLSFYILRQFLFWMGAVLAMSGGLIFLFDSVELFRRVAENEAATFWTIVSMSLMKLPHLIERIFPVATLLATMLTLWRFNRHRELAVLRSFGVSVWQMLLPLVVGAAAFGVLELVAFNPVSTALYAQYQAMEDIVFQRRSAAAAVGENGVWFRQPTGDGHYFMHADTIEPATGRLSAVTVLMVGDDDRLIRRIDADRARLGWGYWALYNVIVETPPAAPRREFAYRLETDLTLEKIEDSFADPATLSFFELPEFVRVLEAAGLSAINHRLHWQSQLAQPLLMVSIVFVAAVFSLRPLRRGGTRLLFVAGLLSGFLLVIAIDVIAALGASARIPVWFAAWSPTIIATMLASAMLFHLEDG